MSGSSRGRGSWPPAGRIAFKICCIRDVEEAELAMRHGAWALGLVSEMPSGPGVIDEDTIAAVAARVGARAETFLLTSLPTAREVADQVGRCGVTTVQLCRELPPAELRRLRALLPEIRIVGVIHMFGESPERSAERMAPWLDALLLDSGNPGAETPVLGGTGLVHDWSVSRRIREAVDRPLFLAGGLRADNVAAAVEAVRPHGVDVCSGVRTGGRLDPGKLGPFIEAVGEVSNRVV